MTARNGKRAGGRTPSAREIHTAAIYALGYLATISAEREDHADAEDLVDRALSLADRQDLAEHWVTVMAHYAVGHCARARAA